MAELLSIENLVALGLLTLLQAVLGFDNLLYISIESKRAPAESQAKVRRLGIGIAVLLRIALLFVLINLIRFFQEPFFGVHNRLIDADFSGHSVIVLVGGAFILYTATKEIFHMVGLDDLEHDDKKTRRSVGATITWIVAMNLVFSFDSILSAMALTDVFWVMAAAIVIGGLLMIWLSDRVAEFLHKNRMYEVLGLFVLFVVGIMLLSEGGHLAHLELLGNAVTPMTKTTFYFVVGVLVLTDVVQGRYQKRLLRMRQKSAPSGA